jgi:hypothetical protein
MLLRRKATGENGVSIVLSYCRRDRRGLGWTSMCDLFLHSPACGFTVAPNERHFLAAYGVRGALGRRGQDHHQDRQEAFDAGGSSDWLRPYVSAQEGLPKWSIRIQVLNANLVVMWMPYGDAYHTGPQVRRMQAPRFIALWWCGSRIREALFGQQLERAGGNMHRVTSGIRT